MWLHLKANEVRWLGWRGEECSEILIMYVIMTWCFQSADSAHSFPPKCPCVGKYRVDLHSFEALALPSLALDASRQRRVTSKGEMTKDCSKEIASSGAIHADTSNAGDAGGVSEEGRRTSLMVIDEVGKMELFSQDFVERVWQLFDDHAPGVGVVLLVTIPVNRPHQKQHRLLQNIRQRKDCKLYEVLCVATTLRVFGKCTVHTVFLHSRLLNQTEINW